MNRLQRRYDVEASDVESTSDIMTVSDIHTITGPEEYALLNQARSVASDQQDVQTLEDIQTLSTGEGMLDRHAAALGQPQYCTMDPTHSQNPSGAVATTGSTSLPSFTAWTKEADEQEREDIEDDENQSTASSFWDRIRRSGRSARHGAFRKGAASAAVVKNSKTERTAEDPIFQLPNEQAANNGITLPTMITLSSGGGKTATPIGAGATASNMNSRASDDKSSVWKQRLCGMRADRLIIMLMLILLIAVGVIVGAMVMSTQQQNGSGSSNANRDSQLIEDIISLTRTPTTPINDILETQPPAVSEIKGQTGPTASPIQSDPTITAPTAPETSTPTVGTATLAPVRTTATLAPVGVAPVAVETSITDAPTATVTTDPGLNAPTSSPTLASTNSTNETKNSTVPDDPRGDYRACNVCGAPNATISNPDAAVLSLNVIDTETTCEDAHRFGLMGFLSPETCIALQTDTLKVDCGCSNLVVTQNEKPETTAPTTTPVTETPTAAPTGLATVPPTNEGMTLSPTSSMETLAEVIIDAWPDAEETLEIEGSPQALAFQWLEAADRMLNLFDTNASKAEAWAVAVFGFSLGYQSWDSSQGWMGQEGVCSWEGITCNGNGRVLGISLPSYGLRGELPVEIGMFANSLYVLDVTNNTIEGELPASIGLLRNLEVFKMDRNRFTGELPDTIGGMENLKVWWLERNIGITGTFPESITSCTELTDLVFYYTGITGVIPPGICNLENLDVLVLDCRQVVSDCWSRCLYRCGGDTGIDCR